MTTSVATAEGSKESKIVYILKLKAGKFYVGATRDLESRVTAHRQGSGAQWTQKHPVVEVVATSNRVADWKEIEKQLTLRMMDQSGWENVRGGPWTQVNLAKPPVALRGETA